MMKLKNLFQNIDLATMVVKNWEYDTLDLFKYWRISANAIYPFKSQGEVRYLRIAPVDEKEENAILAELEFLQYLKKNDYNAIQAIPSKNGRELEVVNTPWGKYYAVVFKGVKGKSLGDVELTENIIFLWGKALGRLHKVSQRYIPQGEKRSNWKDQLDWIKDILVDFPEEKEAIKEHEILKEFLTSLPITDENYGLIHYDFEFDNVFYDESTKDIIPIDFDDAMYHWFAMDIERTFDSIEDCIPTDRVEKVVKRFIEGYRSEYNISDDMISLFPVFLRYANLYGYARVLRSVREQWDNEPEWLVNLRIKLNTLLEKRRSLFGKPIR